MVMRIPARSRAFLPRDERSLREDDPQAARFLADLLGGASAQTPDPDPAAGPDRSWTPDRPEPFFGDAPNDCWQVVARPGVRGFEGLRPDDLVIRRWVADGRPAWRCIPGKTADPASLYRRGPDRVLRHDTVVLRRVRRAAALRARWDVEGTGELVEVCGFFGPNDVRRTEQEIRNAVVARAVAEWDAWHTTAGAPRPEGDAGMFGRLVGYYLAAIRTILPDTLTAAQTAALGAVNYGPLLAAGASAATITAEVTAIRGLLLAGAPGATGADLPGEIDSAIRRARQAHTNAGDFRAWSAAFVTACVRGAQIAQGLEAVIAPGRRRVGGDALLRAALTHAAYTVESRERRAASMPRHRGTYHAFRPDERAPQLGDIIVQDRRDGITAAQVTSLASLAAGLITHGDIVVQVEAGFVVTVGGNVGDSVRKRRYPRNAQGFLVTDRQQLYTQENDAGALPALPAQSAQALAGRSTARIFALLSPVEECAAVPGQPYHGGILV